MKKITAVIMVLAMLVCACACAETVHRQVGVDMSAPLKDMTVHAGFATENIGDTSIDADIYDEITYDIVDATTLKLGDTIETSQGEIVVEKLDTAEDGSMLINGGDDEDGVTLQPMDEDNCWKQMSYGMPAFMMVGQAQLTYGDTVTINVYKMDEDMSPTGDGYDTVEVAGTEAAAKLREIAEKLGGGFDCNGTTVTIGSDEGVITEVKVDYIP